MANYDIVAIELVSYFLFVNDSSDSFIMSIIFNKQVNQLRTMDDADDEDWTNLFKYNVQEVVHLQDWIFLPMRGQLALALTIVGAKCLEQFKLAFRIMW
jgi:hypothetical protein